MEDPFTAQLWPKPRQKVLNVLKAVGPVCLPYLERAISKNKAPTYNALLVRAHKTITKACKGAKK